LKSLIHNWASDWLYCLPSEKFGLCLSDEHFRASICLRYGIKVFSEHFCLCGEVVDEFGNHNFIFRRNGGKVSRHEDLNKEISNTLKKCGFNNRLEPPNFTQTHKLRPDGMTISPWSSGKLMIWDVTCTHSLTSSNLRLCLGETGKAANNVEAKKINKYKLLTNEYIFIRIGFESL